MSVKMKIKKKDRVIILAGKDKGKVGEVLSVIPKENRVVVSGVNMVSRHTKPSPRSEGGIVKKEASIHASNVSHLDPKDNKPVRAGSKIVKDQKVRIARRSGDVIE